MTQTYRIQLPMQETQETWFQPTRGQENLLEEGVATHSNILAWKFVDKGASQPTVHGVVELDTTEHTLRRHKHGLGTYIEIKYVTNGAQRMGCGS